MDGDTSEEGLDILERFVCAFLRYCGAADWFLLVGAGISRWEREID